MKQKTQREQGSILLLTILVMTVVLGVGLGLSGIFINQLELIQGIGDSVIAIYASDAGIERLLYLDAQPVSCLGDAVCIDGRNPGAVSLSNGASYSVIVSAPGGTCGGVAYCLESSGIFKESGRRIFVER